jgi:hypothetical protein
MHSSMTWMGRRNSLIFRCWRVETRLLRGATPLAVGRAFEPDFCRRLSAWKGRPTQTDARSRLSPGRDDRKEPRTPVLGNAAPCPAKSRQGRKKRIRVQVLSSLPGLARIVRVRIRGLTSWAILFRPSRDSQRHLHEGTRRLGRMKVEAFGFRRGYLPTVCVSAPRGTRFQRPIGCQKGRQRARMWALGSMLPWKTAVFPRFAVPR